MVVRLFKGGLSGVSKLLLGSFWAVSRWFLNSLTLFLGCLQVVTMVFLGGC